MANVAAQSSDVTSDSHLMPPPDAFASPSRPSEYAEVAAGQALQLQYLTNQRNELRALLEGYRAKISYCSNDDASAALELKQEMRKHQGQLQIINDQIKAIRGER